MSAYSQAPGQLPYQPAVVLRSNVSPQFHQFIPIINGYAQLEVLNSAQRTPLRGIYAQQVSQNNWQNPMYQMLVNAVGQLGEMLHRTRNVQPEQAIQAAAGEIVACLVAVFAVENSQQLGQYLQSQEARQQVNALVTKFQQYDREITAFFNGGMAAPVQTPQQIYGQAAYGGGGYQNAGYTGVSMPSGPNPLLAGTTKHAAAQVFPDASVGVPTATSTMGLGSLTMGMKSGDANAGSPAGLKELFHMDSLGTQHHETPPDVKPLNIPAMNHAANLAPANAAFKLQEIGLPDAAPSLPEVPAEPVNVQPLPLTEVADSPVDTGWVTLDDTLDWPKVRDRNRPFDAMLLEDGTEIRPYFLAGDWKVKFDAEHPFLRAYDPITHVRMLRKDREGKITEELVTRKEEMNYEDHELNSADRAAYDKARRRDELRPVDMSVISKLQPVPESPLSTQLLPVEGEAVNPEEVVEVKPVVGLDKAIIVKEMTDSHNKLRVELSKNGVERDSNAAFEYYVDVVNARLVTQDDLAVIELMLECESLEGVVDLQSRIGEDKLANVLDDRLTAAVNDALHKNLGFTQWTISSFGEDYLNLITELNAEGYEVVAERLQNYAEEIATRALQFSTQDEVMTFGKNALGITDDDLKGTDLKVLCLTERNSVTVLPWTMSQLRVHLEPGIASLVPESTLPKLHEMLTAILTRTVDVPKLYNHRYLLTRNDEVLGGSELLEIYRGYYVDDAILLGFSTTPADSV